MPVRLNGSTSGYTELSAPAVAGSNTLVLPTGNGSANQFLKNGATAGSLGWSSMVETATGVGIGTTSPGSSLDVAGEIRIYPASGDANLRFGSGGVEKGKIAVNSSSNLLIETAGTERARITSDGHALVGTTSSLNPANGFSLYYASLNSQLHIGHGNTAPNGNAYVVFSYNSGTIGTIVQNGTTGVTYNTSSDYRLKENVSPINGAVARVQQLKPSRFNFITEPDRIVDGFIAHEAQAVVPECVTGEKDAVDADGNPVYQGIDQSKLVPLLTAALQETIAKIETLEARLTALEVTP
jgi:hypothetical protein